MSWFLILYISIFIILALCLVMLILNLWKFRPLPPLGFTGFTGGGGTGDAPQEVMSTMGLQMLAKKRHIMVVSTRNAKIDNYSIQSHPQAGTLLYNNNKLHHWSAGANYEARFAQTLQIPSSSSISALTLTKNNIYVATSNKNLYTIPLPFHASFGLKYTSAPSLPSIAQQLIFDESRQHLWIASVSGSELSLYNHHQSKQFTATATTHNTCNIKESHTFQTDASHIGCVYVLKGSFYFSLLDISHHQWLFRGRLIFTPNSLSSFSVTYDPHTSWIHILYTTASASVDINSYQLYHLHSLDSVGTNWTTPTLLSLSTGKNSAQLLVNPAQRGLLYLLYQDKNGVEWYVSKSTDGGTTFHPIAEHLDNFMPVTKWCVDVHPNSNTSLLGASLASSSCLYLSRT